MDSRKFVRLFALVGVAFAMTACGTIKTRSKDEARVKEIKRVAVVAFQAEEPAGANLLDAALGGDGVGGSMLPKTSKHTDQMYTSLVDAFAKNVGWQVLPPNMMKANPAYKKAYSVTMEGWQNKFPVSKGRNRYNIAEVMDYDCPRILDVQGRDLLMEALGVDALVQAQVMTHLNGFSIMGIGSKKPQSSLSFFVYRKGDKEPTWFEGGIKGDEQESIGKTRFFDEAKLAEKALASAETAFGRINSQQ